MSFCTSLDMNCSQCPHSGGGTLELHKYPQRTHFSAEKHSSNFILFMLKGELLINSEEYPGTILYKNQAVLQAIGSKVELLAVTDVEYIQLNFTEVPAFCSQQMQEVVSLSEAPLTYTPLKLIPRLEHVLNDLAYYFEETPYPCQPYIDMKSKELIHLLITCYPLQMIRPFFYPISTYTESFQYFVMQHYRQVKTTEEFAHLGGYTTTTFRRLFKNLYGIPVYVWILQKKREGILHELLHTSDRINAISQRYGFDNPSHFSHFCKDSFGDTPRSLRKRVQAGEKIKIINRERENYKEGDIQGGEEEEEN